MMIVKQMDDRIAELEAKLAKAVETLNHIVIDCESWYPPSHGAIKYYAQLTLADLKGKTDD